MTSSTRADVRRLPGEEGVWLFIFGDMLVFALFFVTYVYYRSQQVALYDESQLRLSQGMGLTNTLILLTSSWLLALSLRAFRRSSVVLARRLLVATMVFGCAFVICKGVEWTDKITHNITVMSNEFFMFYFMFTGIHLIHVLIGLGVLGFLLTRSNWLQGATSDQAVSTFESGAAFWHLVDLLWVVLFALIYLMR